MLAVGVRGASLSQLLTQFTQLSIEQPIRHTHRFVGGMANRHRDPKWKKDRANKVIRIKLPEYEKLRAQRDGKLSREEIQSNIKKHGVAPGREWNEKPVYISTLNGVIEPYVPPEGDGKATMLSKTGALQKMQQLQKKTTFMWHLRKLKQFEPDFKVADFASTAHDTYVKAHEALAAVDKDKLHELVTEAAYSEMMTNVELKTLRWKMIGSLEPPRVVHLRTQFFTVEDNMFAQITVRMHTQQTLAIFDRFGRLMHGSEAMIKDVLEYVVFERHISNLYGVWRLHAKIIPEWQPNKEPSRRTFVETTPEETPEAESVAREVQPAAESQKEAQAQS